MNLILFLSSSFIVLALDQASKYFISKLLSFGRSFALIPNLFDLTLVHNTGSAFGFFKGNLIFLLITTTLSIGLLIYLYLVYARFHKGLALALGLILGGALGNWIDRFFRGFVIDFLDFYWGVHHWPAFNVADSAITIGACILGFFVIRKIK